MLPPGFRMPPIIDYLNICINWNCQGNYFWATCLLHKKSIIDYNVQIVFHIPGRPSEESTNDLRPSRTVGSL